MTQAVKRVNEMAIKRAVRNSVTETLHRHNKEAVTAFKNTFYLQFL